MKALTQYGLLAEQFWRKHLPQMTSQLETKGQLKEALKEAEERTVQELHDLRQHFQTQGLTPEQAQQRAWEIVSQRYIFLRPEN